MKFYTNHNLVERKLRMKNRKGFTLAEVLVTLAVIGVVAALTIPSIIGSSNEKIAKTSIKKALSVLNQALTMSIAQNEVDAATANSPATLAGLFDDYISFISENTANGTIVASDGFIYTFNSAANCTNVASTTDCFVEVDINGDKGNEDISNTTNYQDLYYFAILKEQVLPVNNTMTAIDATWGRSGGAVASTAIGNVAVEALTN